MHCLKYCEMLKLILFFVLRFNYHALALQCVDHNNNPVDWYVVYKLPLQSDSNSLIAQGAAYTYITSTDTGGWMLSTASINDTNSIVGLTLKPLFTNSPDILKILYNDEAPDGSVMFKKGHTKGLILGNEDGGIWLVHSVPRFPPIDAGKYYFPHNGFQYGQSFLCISFDLNNLDKIGMYSG
ncbi:hypothetical protein ILUMI_13003 [Ignelater luminosus]|uniref:Uncharacterized protein n=1 Tax=Ignelater luminosus TaxID=2038154 RepID=A0A8K0CT27_IGNLU|nr:hypothetical protein ILUMI_13003 [Ignelater luminosus]